MDYGLTVGGPSFTCSCALKAKNASLHEREIALGKKKEGALRKLEGVGQLLIDGNNKLEEFIQHPGSAVIKKWPLSN